MRPRAAIGESRGRAGEQSRRPSLPAPLERPPRLFLRFALATALALAVAGAVVLWVVRQELTVQAERNAAFDTLATVRTGVPQVAKRSDFEGPVTRDRSAQLDRWFRRYVAPQGVVLANFYSRSGRITYSTDPSLIGRMPRDLGELRRGLAPNGHHDVGRLFADFRDGGPKVLESYAPAYVGGSGQPSGVVAFYESYEPVADEIQTASERIAAVLVLMLVGLFMALFPFLRRATSRYEAHNREVQAQAEVLGRAQAENAAVVEAIPDAMFRVRHDGTILDYKAAAFDPVLPPKEFLGRRVSEILPPSVADRIMQAIEVVARTGRPQQFEYELAWNGADGHFEARVVWLSEGQVIALVRDITERQDALAAVERQRRRFEAIFENALDAIVVTDDERRFVDANDAACELLGLRRAALTNRRIDDFVDAQSRGQMQRDWPAFLREGSQAGVLRIIRPDGGTREAEFSSRAHVFPGSHLSIMRDVTQRKSLEEQLRQSQKMETVGRLAGGIAHDFNNLLMAIRGYTELAIANVRSSTITDTGAGIVSDLEEIRGAAARATSLTAQLLAFSRRQIMQPRVVDLNGLLARLENLLLRLVGEQVALELDLDEHASHVLADPGQLEQVVMNLAVNARDAMPEGGNLTIRTQTVAVGGAEAARAGLPSGRYVKLSVSDTGIGMDAETLEHVFEPFFTAKKGANTGLGLSTVYGIVTQSDGHVSVESEPRVGSTFNVLLPRVHAPQPVASGPEPEPELASGTETILVVEDEHEVRRLVERVLERAGYDVLSAAGSREALGLCDTHPGRIHLVLSDVVMPDLTGPELVDRIAAVRGDIKVLYMSGYSHDAVAGHGVANPQTALIQKPFALADLTAKVREVLDFQVADVV